MRCKSDKPSLWDRSSNLLIDIWQREGCIRQIDKDRRRPDLATFPSGLLQVRSVGHFLSEGLRRGVDSRTKEDIADQPEGADFRRISEAFWRKRRKVNR